MKLFAKISIILIVLLNIFSTMCFADVIGPAPYGMSPEEHGAWRRMEEPVTKVSEPDYIKLILIGVTIVIIIVVTILIILKIKKDKKDNNDRKNSNK